MPTTTASISTAATAQNIRSMGEAIIRMADALANAQSIQHDRPAAPSLRQADTSRKSSGHISNPTGDIATDPRRLRVRAAVISGELTAQQITAKATTAAEELETAVMAWSGARW
jgi:hypothetical protein